MGTCVVGSGPDTGGTLPLAGFQDVPVAGGKVGLNQPQMLPQIMTDLADFLDVFLLPGVLFSLR